MAEQGIFQQFEDGAPSKTSGRNAAIGAALVVAVLAMYGVADSNGHETPILLPAGARQLPAINKDDLNFLVERRNASSVRCGKEVTFLGDLFDAGHAGGRTVASVPDYQSTMNLFAPHRLAVTAHEMLQSSSGTAVVVSCPTSPEIIYAPSAGNLTTTTPHPQTLTFSPKNG